MHNLHYRYLTAMLLVPLFIGCGGTSSESEQHFLNAESPAVPALANEIEFAESSQLAVVQATVHQPDDAPKKAAPNTSPESVIQKIIYDTNISMRTESFNGVATEVIQLTEQCGGFIAAAKLSGASGDQRSGSWTIRLPVEQYRAFLDSVGRFGEMISKTENTREVTAEFYDTEARVRNKQTEEKRLITLLEKRPGKLDDVLAFEKEISRVRGEIELLQGRLRVLSNLTAFSTVTL